MKDKNENKMDGMKDKVKGGLKDAAGKVTGDKKKQVEGKADKAKGEVKENIGKMKDKKDEHDHNRNEDI